jgi:hypothetical protein
LVCTTFWYVSLFGVTKNGVYHFLVCITFWYVSLFGVTKNGVLFFGSKKGVKKHSQKWSVFFGSKKGVQKHPLVWGVQKPQKRVKKGQKPQKRGFWAGGVTFRVFTDLRNPISAFYPLENDIYFGHFSKK